MSQLAELNAPRRARRQYAKGFVQAIALLEELATESHARERAAEARMCRGTDLLREVIELQRVVYGASSEETCLRLAARHTELGEHELAAEVLEAIVASYSEPMPQLAEVLRLLAHSYECVGRIPLAKATRELAMETLTAFLGGSSDALTLYRSVAEEIGACSGFGDSPESLEPSHERPKQGDVWWAEFPQFPDDPHLPRPCVVISSREGYMGSGPFQVVPLYSRGLAHLGHVLVRAEECGCPHDSYAKPSQATSVDRKLLIQRVGRVNRSMVRQLINGVQAAL